MNKTMSRLIAVGLVNLILGFAADAIAQAGVWKGPMDIDMGKRTPGGAIYHKPMEWLQGLELSDQQQDQIFKIVYDRAPALREQWKTLRRAHDEMDRLVAAPKFDATRAREVAERAAKAGVEIALIRAEAISSIREVLTPEQRAKLDQKLALKRQR